MKTLSYKRLIIFAITATLLSCNKNETKEGEEGGIYYNERTDKNGSSDTTAATKGRESPSGQNIGNNTDSTTVDGMKDNVSNN